MAIDENNLFAHYALAPEFKTTVLTEKLTEEAGCKVHLFLSVVFCIFTAIFLKLAGN